MPTFCLKCGSIMKGSVCSCGYKQEKDKMLLKEKLMHKERPSGVHDEINPAAVYDHVCRKCGFNKAQLIEIQAWVSDEDTIVQYKCGRCGFTEQEAAKST